MSILFDFKSSMKPFPSVESSRNLFSCLIIVFTALMNLASSDKLPGISAACFLNGRVTFNPFDKEFAKKSFINSLKLSSSTLYAM